jgi:hypothetical protein
MPQIDFLAFATGAGANVETQSAYASDPTTGTGYATGILYSDKINKVLRQASFVAAGMANVVSQALNVDVLDDGNITGFVGHLQSAISSLGAGGASVPLAGGTMTGPLILSGPPVATAGAVTKAYADAITSSAAATYVPLAGGAMTGLLTLSGPPTAPLGAVTKAYADAIATSAGGAVPITGGTMTGLLILSGPPTAALGAATKGYVDTAPNKLITLSGDISGSGTATIAALLPNVNANVGTFQGLTINAKGQVTSATSVAYLTGNQPITLTGDVTGGPGATAITATLPTVNANVGTFQGLTINAKGQVTAAANQNYVTGGPYLPTAGGTITGGLVVGTPTLQPSPVAGDIDCMRLFIQGVAVRAGSGAFVENTGSAVTLTTMAAVNLASIPLGAGDWTVDGSVVFNTGTALITTFEIGASSVSATLPAQPFYTQLSLGGAISGTPWCLPIPQQRFQLAAATTVYLVGLAGFGPGSTVSASAHLAARQN